MTLKQEGKMEAKTPNPIRTIVRGSYDLQKLRIMAGNRVVANFRCKLGQAPGTKADDALDEDAKALLKELKQRHRRITDAIIAEKKEKPMGGKRANETQKTTERERATRIEETDTSQRAITGQETTKEQRAIPSQTPTMRERFTGDEVISTFTEYALVSHYIDLEAAETEQFKRLGVVLTELPVYTQFLSKVRGIGPAMAGVIISEIDIHKAKYPSSLWAYAGLDVAGDGRGRSRRKEHLIKRSYVNAKGEESERDSITYNPWLKTKLMGVLASSFLRSASPYADHYRSYRHRLDTTRSKEDWTKGRVHNASLRYMVKRFLVDLYAAWRTIEGLPVSPEYSEAKQGHRHAA
jgi:hypothetical protein